MIDSALYQIANSKILIASSPLVLKFSAIRFNFGLFLQVLKNLLVIVFKNAFVFQSLVACLSRDKKYIAISSIRQDFTKMSILLLIQEIELKGSKDFV